MHLLLPAGHFGFGQDLKALRYELDLVELFSHRDSDFDGLLLRIMLCISLQGLRASQAVSAPHLARGDVLDRLRADLLPRLILNPYVTRALSRNLLDQILMQLASPG